MAYTFIKAKGGKIGNSLVEDELIINAKEILSLADKLEKQIILPFDTKASKDFENNDQIKTFNSNKIEDDWMGLDIGKESIEKFSQEIFLSNTIFWNGPMGVFEKELFSEGTGSICNSLKQAKQKGVNVIVGGGDSIAALKKLGNKDWVSYISTGGGALLESLEGKTLPGVKSFDAMNIKNKITAIIACMIFISCQSDVSKAYVPESNGNINALTVVMNNSLWEGRLGNNIKESLMEPYEGLPFDEPKYDLYYLQPSIFKGFARSSRNIIVFNKDTVGQGFRLIKNLWARPQVTAIITGEDEDVMNFYFDENKDLLTSINI